MFFRGVVRPLRADLFGLFERLRGRAGAFVSAGAFESTVASAAVAAPAVRAGAAGGAGCATHARIGPGAGIVCCVGAAGKGGGAAAW